MGCFRAFFGLARAGATASLPFGPYALQQDGSGLIDWVLGNEFAGEGLLKDGLSEGCDATQGLVYFSFQHGNFREPLFNFADYLMLLFETAEWENDRFQNRLV